MKLLAAAFFCIVPLLATHHAFAQNPFVNDPALRKRWEEISRREALKQKQYADFAKTLNLAPQQILSITTIRDKCKSQTTRIVHDSMPDIKQVTNDFRSKKITQEEYRNRLRRYVEKDSKQIIPLQKKRNQEIDKLLTPEQRNKVQVFQKANRGFSLATVTLP